MFSLLPQLFPHLILTPTPPHPTPPHPTHLHPLTGASSTAAFGARPLCAAFRLRAIAGRTGRTRAPVGPLLL